MNRRLTLHLNFHVHWYSSIYHKHYPLAAGFSSSVTHGLWILPWNKLSKCSDTEWVCSWIVTACQWHRVTSGQRSGAISNHAFIQMEWLLILCFCYIILCFYHIILCFCHIILCFCHSFMSEHSSTFICLQEAFQLWWIRCERCERPKNKER